MQTYLTRNTQAFDREGIAVVQSHLADEYLAAEHLRELKGRPIFDFIAAARAAGKHIVYSAEDLSSLRNEGIQQLQQDLAGYNVTIIAVYREDISCKLSGYNHRVRNLRWDGPLMDFVSTMVEQSSVMSVADRYVSRFGMDNMIVLDYYGMLAAGYDEAYVFVCELMGVLCDESRILNGGSAVHENHAQDWLGVEAIQMVLHHAVRECNCSLPPRRHNDVLSFILDELQQNAQQLPLVQLDFGRVEAAAARSYGRFHAKFGARIWYDDPATNAAMRSATNLTGIDTEAAQRLPHWRRWTHRMMQVFASRSWVVGCVSICS